MVERVAPPTEEQEQIKRVPAGRIVARDVSAEDYMEHYAEHYYEWVRGYVIKMSPVSLKHDGLTSYLRMLFEAYFALSPIGKVVGAPFVQRIDAAESRREPDLQIILNTNPGQLTDTAMVGPADICIEVVSPTNAATDYGDKFEEYEAGGVKEYWILDPKRKTTRFLLLNDEKVYVPVEPDAEGYYQTPLLPHFKLHVPTLWQDRLPDLLTVVEDVKQMVGK